MKFGSIKLINKSTRFINLYNELQKLWTNYQNQLDTVGLSWTIPTSFYQNEVASVMNNPFYVPTERGLQSIFSLGKNSIQNISDSLFNQFANLDSVARNFTSETLIEPLDISYKNIDGRGYIRKRNDQQFYSLFNGASGYKSTIPIVLVVKYYNEIKKKQKTFLIEEPELNLFPKVQQELIKYLVSETVNKKNQILLTTHSPYTLTALNNLMYAFNVGQNHYEKANNIIDKKYWINPSEVSAYILLKDGRCENILDSEDGLIKAEMIDTISDDINLTYAKLGEIKYGS